MVQGGEGKTPVVSTPVQVQTPSFEQLQKDLGFTPAPPPSPQDFIIIQDNEEEVPASLSPRPPSDEEVPASLSPRPPSDAEDSEPQPPVISPPLEPQTDWRLHSQWSTLLPSHQGGYISDAPKRRC